MLGTRDGDNQLKGKGLQAYRMAVKEMTVAIRDPQRSVGDGLLALVRLMRLFEVYVKGYTRHDLLLILGRFCSDSPRLRCS